MLKRWALFRRKAFYFPSHTQSQSVENRHAVLEWNRKMSSFSVRDLGGVNGVSALYVVYVGEHV